MAEVLLSNIEGGTGMSDWIEIVDRHFTPEEFDAYCRTLQWTAWRPSFVVLHNTGVPSLAQRPEGLTKKHIQSLVSFFRDVQGWHAGPHLFIDDRQIWAFTPLTAPGVHSPSWNRLALGVEMLGDYEVEAFISGRGAKVREYAFAALATLHEVLGLDVNTLRLHREDPKTTHACPGKNVRKLEVIQAVEDLIMILP
jgi:hypothetical protein